MKNKLTRLLFWAAMMTGLLLSKTAQAGNEYFDTFDNYQVMSMGNGVLRFTIPVWVYGDGSDRTYYLAPHTNANDNTNDSYLWFSEKDGESRGSADVHRIVTFGAQRYSNYNERYAGGRGYAFALVDAGSVIVNNTYNGIPLTLVAGDKSHWIINGDDAHNDQVRIEVTRKNTSYVDHIVYLEMDWYIPVELQNKKFYVGLNVHKYRVEDNDSSHKYWWQWGTIFDGGNTPQSPQLFEPYFYSIATEGTGTLGKAAMQYLTYQDPISYHTSLTPTNEVSISDRSSTILVDMQDDVQDNIWAAFHVWVNKDANQKQTLQSNKVMIPAYHKIYDFTATEVRNAQQSVTGDVALEWHTRNPKAQDIMSTDVFEVQRATKEDFSDAESMGMMPLINDSGIYRLTDPAKAVLTVLSDSTRYADGNKISSNMSNIRVHNGDSRVAVIQAELKSSVNVPGRPLYYRVRRASAATWGWAPSEYMATSMLLKSNYLAPLAASQDPYALDPDFEENRIVHFHFKIDNAEISQQLPEPTDVQFDFTPTAVYGLTGTTEEIKAQIATFINLDSIRDILYQDLLAKIQAVGTGRCQWDDNAKLVLVRKLVETGEVSEFNIPKDSVKMQEDGSYLVHFTDEAGLSCVHYQYSVRIDQTNSLLRVQDSKQLNPIALSGPDLYRNQGGKITSFDATDGTDKRGVILTWERTAGSVDSYLLERRENGSAEAFDTLAILTKEGYFDEHVPDQHEVVPGREYEYRVTSSYTCNGTTTTSQMTTIGSRSPYGSISGRVAYADASGCYGTKVTLSYEGGDDITTFTDETGAFLFDSLLYGVSTTYAVTPVSSTAEYRYNNTSSPTATITLTANNNVAENLAFENISSVILSGRVLYKLSSVPVRDANLLLNGKLVMNFSEPVKTDVSGNFSIRVPQKSAFTLQAIKDGHSFEGDGFVRTINEITHEQDSLLTLSKDLPGVRIWDETKVRLSGRVVGGLDQASLPLGQGLSKNNLGDNIRLVLELEGDNISYIVRDPQDLTKDTLEYTVGTTKVHYQHKRIVIEPDSLTGEYEADLFPVKYKVVQATAEGYATLFAKGKTSEVVDLSATKPDTFSITYRAPIEVVYKQSQYGLDYDYCGVKTWTAQSLLGQDVKVDMAVLDSATGEWNYLFGAPVFPVGDYQFRVSAQENYYYNNDRTRVPDIVYLKGGKLKVYNGMRKTTDIFTQPLDAKGTAMVNVTFDHVTLVQTGDSALHSLDFSVETDGAFINSTPLRGYVLGGVEKPSDFMARDTTETGITLLDILRDPPGSGSYAYLEKGTSYHVKYKASYSYRFGVDLQFKFGNNTQYFIGTYAGSPAAGVAAGVLNVLQQTNTFNLPIAIQFTGTSQADYDFTTRERIQTGGDPMHVGPMADVFIGVTNGVTFGKADAFRVVDSASYELLKGQIDNKNVMVVKQGVSADGQPWYLMRTEDILLKQNILSSFTYTQEHIINTVIPQLFYHRNSLLVTGTREEAVAAAEATQRPVYWSKLPTDSVNYAQDGYYEIIKPENYQFAVLDQVRLDNQAICNWIKVIETNEREKVNTKTETPLQTLSVSGGVTQSYTESYAYTNFRSSYVGWPLINKQTGLQSDGMGGFAIAKLKDLFKPEVVDMLDKQMVAAQASTMNAQGDASEAELFVRAEVGNVKFDFDFEPIIEIPPMLPENGLTEGASKTTGYTIAPGAFEHLTFNVYKSKTDVFNKEAKATRHEASDFDSDNKDSYVFGSLLYRTLGGATVCPWEDADSTYFYNTGTPINSATQKIENPQITINRHEMSDVPYDQAARFSITMWNEADEAVGLASGARIKLMLMQDDTTNPLGAKISIDGVPLGEGREFIFNGTQPITKTIEVMAGEAYDYDDICLVLASECTPMSVNQKVCFSVHYMPVSCPVNISMPSDKWIMNTLSPKDNQGYYMPVSIDGFDVNYDNFDHIELQYKLTTQSNDAWVNLCSYYANDSLYQLASGTKQMIRNGKIENYRFYGERDPMEQQYDLRAVSFCRHGSGFITRNSDVLTGTKDTRNPRVFGQPEPADAILGVGDNLKLRFNEAIAGNYLDEDNNFQVTGYTNESGITTGISMHFDGTDNSYAQSKVQRAISNKSFSIDMMVRPTDPNAAGTFFTFEAQTGTLTFGKTADNRLVVTNRGNSLYSLPLPEKMTAFMRVVFVFDYENNKVHFYAGTEEVTDTSGSIPHTHVQYSASAPIFIGKGFEGNIMEVRLWTKALTTDEIALTHLRRLTGYERELVAYYPMNEGKGETLTDKANGATLYAQGATWEHQKGISLHINNGQQVIMDGNLMSRSAKQDETLMLWFKTASNSGKLFSAGWKAATDSTQAKGTLLSIANGSLYLHSNNSQWLIADGQNDDAWHHFVLTVNRTYNNVSIYLDDRMVQTFDASQLGEVSGDMFLGGQGFEGNIDEFILYEQALPQSLMTTFGTLSPRGDEMGLMAYLPFQEMKENDNGILEQVFSINDQRVFKTGEGDVVDKVQPLITGVVGGADINTLADMTESAPVEDIGQLTKMNFDWAFNNDELLININMRDRQINKQTIYITVRDVEDLNGNPMVSPVTWTAFVDKNALKWAKREVNVKATYGEIDEVTRNIRIINYSGKRHQYTIESLPDWVSVDEASGSIDPTDELTLTLNFHPDMAPGVYTDVLYLTDEDELSEPLRVEFTVEALPPYDDIDKGKYPMNMSVCGQVKIGESYDTDENDIVYALFHDECVGQEHIEFNDITGTSKLFLTVFGKKQMVNNELTFQLWQASTGKLFNLTPDRKIIFEHGAAAGCGEGELIIFTTSDSESQNIELTAGWNWISTNLKFLPSESPVNASMSASERWHEGDIIKAPESRQFCIYYQKQQQFSGTLTGWDYTQIYMVYTSTGNTIRLSGDRVPEQDRHISIQGDGLWSSLPCLFDQTTPITEAMADYFSSAVPGDLIKAQNRFAVFSADKKWEGTLKALRPGEGYLMRRMGQGNVDVHFYSQTASPAPKRVNGLEDERGSGFSNPNAATNMTMLARIDQPNMADNMVIRAYIGSELVGVAEAIEVEGEQIFFLTISSDQAGELRFETVDGQKLTANGQKIAYKADAHHGTIESPVLLTPDGQQPTAYKVIEDGHVTIIRGGERYDVTGVKLQ